MISFTRDYTSLDNVYHFDGQSAYWSPWSSTGAFTDSGIIQSVDVSWSAQANRPFQDARFEIRYGDWSVYPSGPPKTTFSDSSSTGTFSGTTSFEAPFQSNGSNTYWSMRIQGDGADVVLTDWSAEVDISISDPALRAAAIPGQPSLSENETDPYYFRVYPELLDDVDATVTEDTNFNWRINHADTDDSDFVGNTYGTGVIRAGRDFADIGIAVRNDTLIEGFETFEFEVGYGDLRDPANVTGSQTMTITDNDRERNVAISNETVTEGETADLSLYLSHPFEDDVSVRYNTSSGSAFDGSDYVGVSGGTATISAGTQTTTISIPTIEDSWNESREDFEVQLTGLVGSPTNVAIEDAVGRVTIDDDDPARSLSVDDATIMEGETENLRVRMSDPADNDIRVSYDIGSAGSDLDPTSGTFTIRAGETVADVPITATPDSLREDTEQFTFRVTDASYGTEVNGANATISVVDQPVTITRDITLPFSLSDGLTDIYSDNGISSVLDERYRFSFLEDQPISFDTPIPAAGATASIGATMDGNVSLAAFIEAPGLGQIDLDYPLSADLSFPDRILPGESVDFQASIDGWEAAPGLSGETLSFGDLGLEGGVDINAGSGIDSVNFLDLPLVEPVFSADVPLTLANDLSFEGDIVTFGMGQEYSLPGFLKGIGGVSLAAPQGGQLEYNLGEVDTPSDTLLPSIGGAGFESLISANISVSELLSKLSLMFPPTAPAAPFLSALNHQLSADVGDASFSAGYNIFDIFLDVGFDLKQSVEYRPDGVEVDVNVDGQNIASGRVGEQLTGSIPDSFDDSAALGFDFNLNGALTTLIELVPTGGISWDALSASLSAEFANFSSDFSFSAVDMAEIWRGRAEGMAIQVFEQSLENFSLPVVSRTFDISGGQLPQSAPTLLPTPDVRVIENTQNLEVIYVAQATDAEGDDLTYRVSGTDGSAFRINESSGAVRFERSPDFEAPEDADGDNVYHTIVEAVDATGRTDTQAVEIRVLDENENDPPQASDDSATTRRDTAVTLTAADLTGNEADPDGDDLAIASVGNASNGNAVLNSDGTVTFTPDAVFAGAAGFDYNVSDGQGGEDTARVDVTVEATNRAPIALDDTAQTTEGEAINIKVLTNDTDEDEDVLVVASVGAASSGDVINNGDGTITYTPESDFFGVDSFDYKADDGEGGTDTATVSVEVRKDSDGDGVADNEDNAIFVANPEQRDTDGDGYANVIDADMTNDGAIDVDDLLIFRDHFGSTGITDEIDAAADADFDGNGAVDVDDLLIFRDLFGKPMGESYADDFMG